MSFEFWNRKSFVLISGASKGLGRAIAIEFSKHLGKGSVLLLLARSASGLEDTKAVILKESPNVTVVVKSVDLGSPDPEEYLHVIQSAASMDDGAATDFEHALLVHNAATLGNLSLKVSQFEDLKEIQNYYATNLFSLILLNSQFLRVFNDVTRERTVVHITSKGAMEPFKTWGYYCAGKAARTMLMRSLASEDPSVSVMNYAPGHFASAIYDEAEKNTGDEETRLYFEEDRKLGRIITAEQSAIKLAQILSEKKYTKAEYVDYYKV